MKYGNSEHLQYVKKMAVFNNRGDGVTFLITITKINGKCSVFFQRSDNLDLFLENKILAKNRLPSGHVSYAIILSLKIF